MTADHLLQQARERLAEIQRERAALDAEEAKLRAMVTAAEGQPEPVKLVPLPVAPAPTPLMPWELPYPLSPIVPWQPIRADHGGMCACPHCCPPVYCRTVTIADNGVRLGQPLRVGDMTGCIVDSDQRYGVS